MESNVFDSIMTGLNEATEDAKSGKPPLERRKGDLPLSLSDDEKIDMRDEYDFLALNSRKNQYSGKAKLQVTSRLR